MRNELSDWIIINLILISSLSLLLCMRLCVYGVRVNRMLNKNICFNHTVNEWLHESSAESCSLFRKFATGLSISCTFVLIVAFGYNAEQYSRYKLISHLNLRIITLNFSLPFFFWLKNRLTSHMLHVPDASQICLIFHSLFIFRTV